MFVKTLLLLMAANALSAVHIGHPENRIIGGSHTAIETAPWQVFLERHEKSITNICGGSLIRPDIVLTAGHCVSSNSILTKYTVRVGSSNKKKGGQLLTVAKILVHEYIDIDEKEGRFLNDIAVLRLSNPVKIGPSVQTISLATYAPPAGAQALITGWGRIVYFVEEKPIILQGINVTILSAAECHQLPGANKGNICAGSNEKTTCKGDSGGALVVNNQVVGVSSAVKITCNMPALYASVPYYHQWILGAIDKAYSLL